MIKKIILLILAMNFYVLALDFGLIKVGFEGTKDLIIEDFVGDKMLQ